MVQRRTTVTSDSKDIIQLIRVDMEEIRTKLRNNIKRTIHDVITHGLTHLSMDLIDTRYKVIPGTLIAESIGKMNITILKKNLVRTDLRICNRLHADMAEDRIVVIQGRSLEEHLGQQLRVSRLGDHTQYTHDEAMLITVMSDSVLRTTEQITLTGIITKGMTVCLSSLRNLGNIDHTTESTKELRHVKLIILR